MLAIARAVIPDVVGEFRSAAVLELQGLGRTVNVVMTADDPFCEHISQVVGQNPPAGTAVTSGATVVIWVAKPPPGGCY